VAFLIQTIVLQPCYLASGYHHIGHVWAISAMTNNLASRALCVFALAREAQSNDVANSIPLFVHLADRAIAPPIASLSFCPACVLTPPIRHCLPSEKPSRHALPVRLPCFSHAGHMIFLSQTRGATPEQEARTSDATRGWLRAMDV
jgi:hypothetical protein